MFDAVVELVQRSADETPLLLVLEDLHWADATSLRLLNHLAGSDLRAPVVVTCTRRTTEATTGPALVDTMAALARAGAERIRLDGLDTGAVGELLRARSGSTTPGWTRWLPTGPGATRSSSCSTPGCSRQLPTCSPWRRRPPRARWHPRRPAAARPRLPEEAATVLTAAAVLGRRIDPELVSELAGLPVDRCLDLLDLAMTSGLVEEQDAGYTFVHALARETMSAR